MLIRILPVLLFFVPIMALNSFVITDQEQCGFPIFPDYPNSSFIKVQSWIPDVSFKANYSIEAQIPKPKEGIIFLVIPADTRQKIKVNAPDFAQGEFTIEAMPVKNTRCIAIEPKSRSAIKGKGSFSLKTVPAGVNIAVDGIPTFSEKSPYTFENWATGVQSLTLTKNRYQPVEVEIEIEKDRARSKTVEMKPNWGDVTFQANVPDAKVDFDGKSYSLPASFIGEVDGLTPGKYKARISSAGYKTVEREFTIVAQSRRDISENLILTEGILNFQGSPRGALVMVDGNSICTTPCSTTMLVGVHRVYIAMPNYRTEDTIINIQTRNVRFSTSLTLISGNVELNGYSGSQVQLDGRSSGQLPLELKGVPMGQHTVLITHPSHQDLSQSFTVSSVLQSINLKQVPLDAYLTVNSTPPGAEVFLDGQSIGTTPLNEMRLAGGFEQRVIKLRLNGYDEASQSQILRPNAHERVHLGLSDMMFTDYRDGKKYRKVKIGNQTWMAQNLNFEIGNSGCYQNDPENCKTDGRLYVWETARNACPPGWHLPSDQEWDSLVEAVGGGVNSGIKLKTTSGWARYGLFWMFSGNGTDNYGFSALPAGYDDYDGWRLRGSCAYFWSASEFNTNNASFRYLCAGSPSMYSYYYGNNNNSYSLRCRQN